MRKTFIVVALCLCALPAMMARSLSEEELLATRMLLDLPSGAMTPEEAMVMASGMYGVGSVGQYGGLPDGTDASTDVPATTDTSAFTPESAKESTTSSTPAPPAATPAKKSSASTAQMSLMAGAVAAAAVLLL